MKKISICVLMIIILLMAGACTTGTGSTPGTNNGDTTDDTQSGGTADHDSPALLSGLSQETLDQVRGCNIFFQHASVGGNVVSGLNDLAGEDASRYSLTIESDTASNLATWFASNTGFGDNNIGNPASNVKVSTFEDSITSGGIGAVADIAMMKFCYIDVSNYSDAASQFAAYRDMMLRCESQYMDVDFIWWTIPIMTTSNTFRNTYNDLVRDYCSENNKWLYDLADIESHDPSGNHYTDTNGEYMHADYSDDGGHLNTTGRKRAAEALWVLLSDIVSQ